MGSGPDESDPLADTAAAQPEPLADTAAASPASGSEVANAGRATLQAGATLGRYVILRELGAGGMGSVYAARDPELAREVAIKILHPGLSDQRARLLSEARTAAKLRHPNIVTVYDVGTQGDVLFVAMELVEGQTLRAWLTERRPWNEVIATFGQAARGLAAAHEASVVHRDFKPDNVLLANDGRVVVTDFGLARMLDDERRTASGAGDVRLTQTGAVLGTPAYMSPEQFEGATVDARSDQFSFGVALFEAAYGVSPFRGATFDERRESVLGGVVIEPPAADVPPRVRAALLRSLARDADQRFASIDAMLAELQPPARRRRWPAIAIAVALVAAVATVAVVVARRSSAPRRPPIELAAEQPLARPGTGTLVAFLRDGHVLRATGESLQLEELGGTVISRVPKPDDQPVITMFGTGDSDVVAIATGQLPQCQWWRLQVSTGRATRLGTAEECARSVFIGYDGRRLALAYGPGGLVVRDADSGTPGWSKAIPATNAIFSPDGRRIAVIGTGTIVVVDAQTGDEILRAKSNQCSWLDANWLLYTTATSDPASRLAESVLEAAKFSPTDVRTVISKDEIIYRGNQNITALAATRDGIIIGTEFGHRSLYVVPSAPVVPVRLETQKPETTGAVNDDRAVAWTREGEVISEGNIRNRAVLIKTKPGARGSVLATFDASELGRGTSTGDQIWYRAHLRDDENRTCALGTVEIETGAMTEWRRGDCRKEPLLVCAAVAPRCIAVEANGAGSSSWFDPNTRQLREAAPRFIGALAPDGGSAARVDTDLRVKIRSLDGSELAAITPTPSFFPDAGDAMYLSVQWMPDGHSLLLVIQSRTNGVSRLVRLELDGTWRDLAESDSLEIADPVPSRDGALVAMTASAVNSSWQLFPIVAIHDD